MSAAGLLAVAAGLVLACLVSIPSAAGRPRVPLAALALAPVAAVTLVLLSAGGSLARSEAGPLDQAVRSGTSFTAVLSVTGEPSLLEPGAFDGGDRYLVDGDVIGGVVHGDSFAARTPVVVIASSEWAGVGTGDTVRVIGTVKAPDRVGKAAAVLLPSSRPTIAAAGGWLGYTGDLRDRFRHQAVQDSRDGGLLPGMALGDRIGLNSELEQAMQTTGLTHLTAVSGANCSYVVAFVFLGLRAVRVPRLPACTSAIVALAGFVMLVRPEPSVLRAAVMGTIGVAAVLSGRGKVSLTLLLLSIIVLLAVDPWLSISFAFMLSVAATLGLVTAGPMVAAALGTALPRSIAQILAIPLTAQLFCTPIIVLIQPALPAYSLPANVLASPVVPAITLLGMVAVLALVAAPVLAPPLIGAAQWGTRWVAGVAETLATAPGATLPWIAGPPGAIVAALASLASLALLLLLAQHTAVAGRVKVPLTQRLRVVGAPGAFLRQHRHPRRGQAISGSAPLAGRGSFPGHGAASGGAPRVPGGPGRTFRSPARTCRSEPHVAPAEYDRVPVPARRRRGILFAVSFLLVAAIPAGLLLLGRIDTPARGDWVMALCDVGQGDGIVVRTTPGHAMVVDTGPEPGAMDRCLDRLQVDVIDALVITHLHDDHYGGVGGAIRDRAVSAIYYSSGEERLPSEVTAAAAAAGVEAEKLSSTTVIDLLPITVELLWPRPGAATFEENNASAVLEVVVPTSDRPVTLLLTGDLEEDAADVLLSTATGLSERGVDVLKVAHHGARNGGSSLIEAVDPGLALISVGEDNDYGHPHPAILETLARSGIATARTDELGSFTVEVVGSTMEVRELR